MIKIGKVNFLLVKTFSGNEELAKTIRIAVTHIIPNPNIITNIKGNVDEAWFIFTYCHYLLLLCLSNFRVYYYK